jgi:two-component system, LuxR family, response regulator FixJ
VVGAETMKATVFVVDDDSACCSSIRCILADMDWQVEVYPDADRFLAAYDRSKIGCLLLDVHLPGTGGLDLQKLLVEEGADVPVIFLSGHADVPTVVQALKAGAFDFIKKPLRAEDLIQSLKNAIDVHRQRRRCVGRQRPSQSLPPARHQPHHPI